MQTLAEQAKDLEQGRTTARALAEAALAKIDTQRKAGIPAFISVNAARVLRDADHSDARRKAGRAFSRHDGVPFAVKDLFDVEGEVTTTGSVVLKDEAPAVRDSDSVGALRALGFIPLGRTNMTEFAYSGLGLNPHYGTPPSVYAVDGPRIPGGSSSGTAVAVASGVCSFGLGTDTGGSCRIPAAFNGIAGYKPTARRISQRGVFPLSKSLDSVGPLGVSAACCATIDGILAGGIVDPPTAAHRGPYRLAVLQTLVLDNLSAVVAADYERCLKRLSAQGFELVDVALPDVLQLPGLLKNGGIVAYEASRAHAGRLEAKRNHYDPRVAGRMAFGFATDDAAYANLLAERQKMISAFGTMMEGFDAVICPTVQMEPPLIADCAADADYMRLNGMSLRNTYVFNFLDGCSGSVPMSEPGRAPTGLMVSAPGMGDQGLLQLMRHVDLSTR